MSVLTIADVAATILNELSNSAYSIAFVNQYTFEERLEPRVVPATFPAAVIPVAKRLVAVF